MRTRLKLKPGQRGTKKLLAEYGEQMICVRYRYDAERRRRLKTVELIVEEVPWEPRSSKVTEETIVGVRVAWGERELYSRVKGAGGVWNKERRVWELRYGQVVALGMEARIVPTSSASNSRDRSASNSR
jgi:hypothetical protein